jgi:hypothetical protein
MLLPVVAGCGWVCYKVISYCGGRVQVLQASDAVLPAMSSTLLSVQARLCLQSYQPNMPAVDAASR